MLSAGAQSEPTVLRLWEKENVRILTVEGPLTINCLFGFQDAWRGESAPALVFDLSAVPYADSAAIGSIVNAFVSRQRAGRLMSLVARERVRAVMKITKVESLFPIFDTVEEAVASAKEHLL